MSLKTEIIALPFELLLSYFYASGCESVLHSREVLRVLRSSGGAMAIWPYQDIAQHAGVIEMKLLKVGHQHGSYPFPVPLHFFPFI